MNAHFHQWALAGQTAPHFQYSVWLLICLHRMAPGMLDSGPDIELQLVRRVAAGDAQALRRIYTLHGVRLFQYLKRFLRDQSAAEDVLAEVFIDFWKDAGRFEGRASLNTWLCAMARNKAISHLRKYPSARDPGEMADVADDADTPEAGLQKLDKGAKLRACMERLSPEHREVIDLVYYHDKSIAEVTQILGVPANTVKTRMFYARKKLSELLAAAGIDRGWP